MEWTKNHMSKVTAFDKEDILLGMIALRQVFFFSFSSVFNAQKSLERQSIFGEKLGKIEITVLNVLGAIYGDEVTEHS